MSFLNPWLLYGILGVASPIIIHLLARKQTRRVVWAAMRFLKATVDRKRRRMTLEDIVLLTMRCLVVALFAIALARPTLRSSSAGLLGVGETAIVLLDNSGSMITTDGAATRFEKAQKAAEQIIDALPAGSSVAVWLVSDIVRDIVPEPTRDLALARKVIRETKRTDRATQWPSALRRALEVAARTAGVGKLLYVVTDGQAAGWKGIAETRNLLEAAREDVHARLVLVSDAEQANVGITHLRLASAMTPVGQPLRFEVGVANFGSEDLRDVIVSLAIDENPPSEEQVIPSIPANGEPKAISLFATFQQPGFHTVTARLRKDRCAFDDARTLALKVIDQIDVLLVDGDPGSEPRDSEVFYLRNALTPVPPEARDQYFIKTKTVNPAAFEQTSLAEFETIVLANVVDLSAAAVVAVENYVRGGGGLMVFPGARINLAFYNDRLHLGSRLLPAAFGAPRGEVADAPNAAPPTTYFTLQNKGYDHRIVHPWNDPKSGTLATAQFYRAFPLIPARAGNDPAEVGAPGVVLSFSDGLPAIVERTFGFGRILQFASTADTAWNDLPIRPIFLPLIHRALGYLLARQEDRLNVRAGSPFSYVFGTEFAGKQVLVVEPGASKENARPHPLELQNQSPTLRYLDTDLAGAYSVELPDQPQAPLRFAAFFDPAECDLKELPAADLKTLEQVATIIRWTPGTDLRARLHRERTGTELWLPFLLAVLALAVVETVLGNRWSRSK